MESRTNHSNEHILQTRAHVLSHLSERCERLGRSFNEDCPLAPETELGLLYVNVLSKDATKGIKEDQVRELGRFANDLGLDGFEKAKWFLRASQLRNKKVCKRVRDAIKKHARLQHGKKRVKVSAVEIPAIDGLKLTVRIGRIRTTHVLSFGDSITVSVIRAVGSRIVRKVGVEKTIQCDSGRAEDAMPPEP